MRVAKPPLRYSSFSEGNLHGHRARQDSIMSGSAVPLNEGLCCNYKHIFSNRIPSNRTDKSNESWADMIESPGIRSSRVMSACSANLTLSPSSMLEFIVLQQCSSSRPQDLRTCNRLKVINNLQYYRNPLNSTVASRTSPVSSFMRLVDALIYF